MRACHTIHVRPRRDSSLSTIPAPPSGENGCFPRLFLRPPDSPCPSLSMAATPRCTYAETPGWLWALCACYRTGSSVLTSNYAVNGLRNILRSTPPPLPSKATSRCFLRWLREPLLLLSPPPPGTSPPYPSLSAHLTIVLSPRQPFPDVCCPHASRPFQRPPPVP